jgi:hypothetical protein
VNSIHALPRFGHNDNLAAVVTNEEGWRDYASGTVFIGCFILAIFFAWSMLEILFALCGKKVGILSGKRIYEDNRGNCCYRVLLLINCLFSFVVSMIFLVRATLSLATTFDSIHDNMTTLGDMARSVTSIVDSVIQAANETIPVRDDVVVMLEEGLCSSFPGANGESIDLDGLGLTAIGKLSELSDFTNGELTVLRNSFETEFVAAETEVLRVLDTAEDYARISYYAIAIVVVTLLLTLQSHMAWTGPHFSAFFCFQKWITVPAFYILLAFSAIVTAALSAVLIVNTGKNERGGVDG